MVYSDRVGGVSVLFRDFEDDPIMQFTGLKDANGVEIYEGDIVEYFSDFAGSKTNHQVKYFGNQRAASALPAPKRLTIAASCRLTKCESMRRLVVWSL